MRSIWCGMAGLIVCCAPLAARAEPGLADEVYGAGVTKGQAEFELRAGRLQSGAGDGEWAAIAEAAYGVTDWWRPAVLAEWEREAGGKSALEAVAIENVFDLTATRSWPVHFGLYAEYEFNVNSAADKTELKLLAQRTRGPWDGRLNLVAEREVGGGASDVTEFEYATQITYRLNDDFKLGVQGFGDLGTDDDFGSLGDRPHYWGPMAEFETLETSKGELEIQVGYLFGFGENEADGQPRIKLEWETKF